MGPAHSTVVNQTSNPICVITFNMADLIYKSNNWYIFIQIYIYLYNYSNIYLFIQAYHTMYIIEPGESSVVEANPDAVGLKVGFGVGAAVVTT